MAFRSSTSNSSWTSLFSKLLVYLALLLGLSALFLISTKAALRRALGPDVASQIAFDFETVEREEPMDTLVMGGSKMYRGVDPSKLQGRAFNFAHDGDGWNHVYYKLDFLRRRGKLPHQVIADLNYSGFAWLDPTQRAYYDPYFPAEFGRDYQDLVGQGRWGEHLNTQACLWMVRSFSLPGPFLLKAALAPAGSLRQELTPGGQLLVPSSAPYTRSAYEPIHRSGAHRPVVDQYFRAVVEFCRATGVHLVLVMPPVTIYEQAAYSPRTKADFWAFIASQAPGVPLLNFETDRSYTFYDFADAIHLNPQGAERFSRALQAKLR